MTDIPSDTAKNTAQQWAWEFLRGNPTYRDAFHMVTALSPEQLKLISKYNIEEEDWSWSWTYPDSTDSLEILDLGCILH